MRRSAAALLACGLAATPAAARADLFSSISYGVHVSTIGSGITLEKPLLYDFSARIATGAGSISQQISYDKTPYTATTKFSNVAVIADFRPSGGRYRLSSGLVFGNDRIDGTSATDASTIGVGNGVYPTAGTGTVSTRLNFDHPSVYAGVGTGTGLIRGFALAFDVGVLVRNGTPSTTASGPLITDPAFRTDLGRLRNELKTRVVVPVLSLGLVFRP
jgi:hypothetical protein